MCVRAGVYEHTYACVYLRVTLLPEKLKHFVFPESNPGLKAAENRTVLPSKADLDGAAQSLALLQRVYLLPMKHLVNGRILDTDSSVSQYERVFVLISS